ncbi:MAG: DUF1667 domain-containing protein [Clostridiales bacterium]|nr:DUF1667 domain-containing protein [Clostridiales bacterium]
MKKIITCIACPRGCQIEVSLDDNNTVTGVIGNLCPKGKDYSVQEVTQPQRMLTTTVRVNNGVYPSVPVKTQSPIPKESIMQAIHELSKVCVSAPVFAGDIILENVADSGVNVIATYNNPKITEE